jgi:hypothetical protein
LITFRFQLGKRSKYQDLMVCFAHDFNQSIPILLIVFPTQTGDRLKSFWHQYLHAPLPVLTLPLDKIRTASSSFNADAFSLSLNATSSERLRDATERLGTTLQIVLLSAFQAFLFRYSGQDEILISTPVSGRVDSSVHDMFGTV